MKKIKYILSFFIIALVLLYVQVVNWNYSYNDYINYTSTGETYVKYYYNDRLYKIIVPETREQFIQLEYMYWSGQLKLWDKYYKTVKLNILLTHRWLENLYY